MTRVHFDSRAITINGKRTFLVSGAMHYARSTPAMWPALMGRAKQAGLNTIETYVFWGLHERQRGVLDLSDRLDLLQFCRLAQEHGLYVFLRIGPYACAEINYGGFPAWLRDISGMQMRTWNEPFQREMERWVRFVCEYLRPMFAPRGGPIILAQIENEYDIVAATYGKAGRRYLRWAVELCHSLQLGIPWVLCLPLGKLGWAPGALATINDWYAHRRLPNFFHEFPGQPALWTEVWPGWYTVWGSPQMRRSPQDLAYAVARFVAAGGSGINYYMWHGGTNFGRDPMYLQTTSYDFDAPLDEYGLPTTKCNHLARFHRLFHNQSTLLLSVRPPAPRRLGDKQWAYCYQRGGSALTFLCNDDFERGAEVKWQGNRCKLAPASVKILSAERLLMDTSAVNPRHRIMIAMTPKPPMRSGWRWWQEPIPFQRNDAGRDAVRARQPPEQLELTRDSSDYCWYITRLSVPRPSRAEDTLRFDGVADLVHLFVDGRRVASTSTRLLEQRGPFDAAAWKQSFPLRLRPGSRDLAILCVSLGLIKHDMQIGDQNMTAERKGVWGAVRWNGKALPGPWVMRTGLAGERRQIFGAGGEWADWQTQLRLRVQRPLCWWRCEFPRPSGSEPLALDLQGMSKGLIHLNGRCAGRYWLIRADDRKLDPFFRPAITAEGAGEPTQRYYHLPLDWLEDRNVLVLFEEIGGDPSQVRLCRRSIRTHSRLPIRVLG